MRTGIARRVRRAGLLLALAAVAAVTMLPGRQAVAWAQSGGTARLEITGAVRTPLFLSAADLKTMPRTAVRTGGQDGQLTQVWEGVALSELLQRAGVPQGEDLGGPWLAAYVAAVAADGYRVVFAVPELDEAFGDAQVVVADTLDGAPLGEGMGPFRLIVPGDRRAARWVRMLQSVTVAGM